MPPLSVDGLRQTIEQTTAAVRKIDPTQLIPQHEIETMWKDMQAAATRENVSVFDIGSTMTLYSLNQLGSISLGALSSVKVAGNLLDRHILDHYRQSLNEIRDRGFYQTLAESSKPYTSAVWENFHADRTTWTEDLLDGTMFGKAWTGLRNWFTPAQPDSNPANAGPSRDVAADVDSAANDD
jgi:hypothetical protein